MSNAAAILKPDEFEFIAQTIKKRSGLALTTDKAYLLESRLTPIARSAGHKDVGELVRALKKMPVEKILHEVTEAMTTNESLFFRDMRPFEQLRKVVLPRLKEAQADKKSLRIWSAACSTGQEAYSVIMSLLEEAPKMPGWTYEIIGTDISPKVVEKAKAGIYTQFEVQRGMPIQMLIKYFKQLDEGTWQIQDKLRAMVNFRFANLLEDFSLMGKFDIIMCRNVLIYFDEPTKSQVLDRLAQCMTPKGILYLGSSETIIGLTSKLKLIDGERGLYELA